MFGILFFKGRIYQAVRLLGYDEDGEAERLWSCRGPIRT